MAAHRGESWRPVKYGVWTLLVWIPAIVLAVEASDPACSHTDSGCIGPSPHTDVALVLMSGFVIYVIGLLALLSWDRSRHPDR